MSRTQLRTASAKTKGFTLVEIAIVLGIIGLILGAVWTAASSVYANQRNTNANTAILTIAQGIRTLEATSSTVGTAGDLTSSMITAGVIPGNLVSGTTAIAPYPGSTLKIMTLAAADQSFTIEINKVPQAGCIALASTVAGTNRDPGLTSVGLTTASAPAVLAAPGVALTATLVPITSAMTVALATTGCSATTSANTVQFEFTLH